METGLLNPEAQVLSLEGKDQQTFHSLNRQPHLTIQEEHELNGAADYRKAERLDLCGDQPAVDPGTVDESPANHIGTHQSHQRYNSA